MPVGTMLREMTARELSLWMAYSKVDAEKWEKESGKKEPPTEEDDTQEKHDLFAERMKGFMSRKGIASNG